MTTDPFGTVVNALVLAEQGVDPGNLAKAVGDSSGLSFSAAMLASIILGALAYSLLQYGVVRDKRATWVGMGLFAVGVILAFVASPSGDSTALIRFCFSTLALSGGLAFVVAREPVHAALGFATAVLSSCGVLFMQEAYFVAAATMIVYAGATIIIFLFVLMFAQQTNLRAYDLKLTKPLFAAATATALVIAITWSVSQDGEVLQPKTDTTRIHSATTDVVSSTSVVPSKTAGLGRAMYTDYLMAIELAGTILLVATIGAIILAQRPVEETA